MPRKPSTVPGDNGRVRRNYEFWPETVSKLDYIIRDRFDKRNADYTETTILAELVSQEYDKLKAANEAAYTAEIERRQALGIDF